MGNRAVIEMQGEEVGIYLHWNGGLDTVKPMLDVAWEYGLRGGDYGMARLAQMFGNFLGGTLSVGIGVVARMDKDNWDNGTYVIDENFNIIDRLYVRGPEQNVYDYNETVTAIKNANDQFFLKGG